MIKAFQLLFSPFETWEKITTSERGFLWTLFFHLLPMLVIMVGLECFLLVEWGEGGRRFTVTRAVPAELALRYGASYLCCCWAVFY
jgi:hypothetical protein